MRIGETVEIPIRAERRRRVQEVARGTVIGFTRGLILVRWPDRLVVPYYRDQIGPPGAFAVGAHWPVSPPARRAA